VSDDLRRELEEEIRSRGLAMSLQEALKLAGFVGRRPTPLELHLFDTMWSEHCSYKSSRPVLRGLPTEGDDVIIGPGEDAGVVRFCSHGGRDYALVVAHESHNHPSQVLPEEGAATGVGGIVRDIYCMGASVIGVLDALRFGDPLGPGGAKARSVVRGVVQGIWRYGNALGVPNLGGDTVFDEGYDENCLVNVVALGIADSSRIVHSYAPPEARREPYVLVLAGKPTDDTGFGGATFASADLEEEADKGAVQVADPFLKRVLTEANLVVQDLLHSRGISFGFKDLGAGGLACVSSEMAAHGELGMELDLDSVPVALKGLPPEVIACAETQERYGLAVPEAVAEDVLDIYNRDYELPRLYPGAGAAVVGRFVHSPEYRVRMGGAEVACAPVSCITEGVEYRRPAEPAAGPPAPPELPACDPASHLERLLASVAGASRHPVWSYYDSEVQGATHLRPGEADSVVVRPVPGCPAGLAVTVDGNPWIGRLDPRAGGAHAVGEAVRNLVATGAIPIAVTDCLNYGNPEDPEVFWQFRQGVEGITEACSHLGLKGEAPLPVVSGNVSFYNQSPGGRAIPPSPVVAAFGKLDRLTDAVDISLKAPGNPLLLVGPRRDELGGSLYQRVIGGGCGGAPPAFRPRLERRMALLVLDLVGTGAVLACHDISEGGLLVCAAEMALATLGSTCLGAVLHWDDDPLLLFAETPGYLLELDRDALAGLDLPGDICFRLGEVSGRPELSCGGWSLDLRAPAQQRETLLHRIVWREESADG